jgi:predicted Ser/Thr protein kinase
MIDYEHNIYVFNMTDKYDVFVKNYNIVNIINDISKERINLNSQPKPKSTAKLTKINDNVNFNTKQHQLCQESSTEIAFDISSCSESSSDRSDMSSGQSESKNTNGNKQTNNQIDKQTNDKTDKKSNNDKIFIELDGGLLAKCVRFRTFESMLKFNKEIYYNNLITKLGMNFTPVIIDKFVGTTHMEHMDDVRKVLKRYQCISQAENPISDMFMLDNAGKIMENIYGVIIYEKINGYTLHDLCNHRYGTTKLPINVSDELMIDVFNQLLQITEQLNSISVVHGDIHTKNIMVSNNSKVYLIDYEFAGDFIHSNPNIGSYLFMHMEKKILSAHNLITGLKIDSLNSNIFTKIVYYFDISAKEIYGNFCLYAKCINRYQMYMTIFISVYEFLDKTNQTEFNKLWTYYTSRYMLDDMFSGFM